MHHLNILLQCYNSENKVVAPNFAHRGSMDGVSLF